MGPWRGKGHCVFKSDLGISMSGKSKADGRKKVGQDSVLGGNFLTIGEEVTDLKAAPRDFDAPGENANRV